MAKGKELKRARGAYEVLRGATKRSRGAHKVSQVHTRRSRGALDASQALTRQIRVHSASQALTECSQSIRDAHTV